MGKVMGKVMGGWVLGGMEGLRGLVPAVDVQVWHLGAVEDGVFALLFLLAVVFEEAEGVFAVQTLSRDAHTPTNTTRPPDRALNVHSIQR